MTDTRRFSGEFADSASECTLPGEWLNRPPLPEGAPTAPTWHRPTCRRSHPRGPRTGRPSIAGVAAACLWNLTRRRFGAWITYRFSGGDEEQFLLGAREIAEDHTEIEVYCPVAARRGAGQRQGRRDRRLRAAQRQGRQDRDRQRRTLRRLTATGQSMTWWLPRRADGSVSISAWGHTARLELEVHLDLVERGGRRRCGRGPPRSRSPRRRPRPRGGARGRRPRCGW